MKKWLPGVVLLVSGCNGGGDGRCGTADHALPAGLATLEWHSDVNDGSIRGKNFRVTVGNLPPFDLDEEPLFEGVRFDLDRPARVHGFSVRWTNLASYEGKEIEAGLYRDFGHNGFDYWRSGDPHWSGTRCTRDVRDGEWTDYVLEDPVEIAQPGLVYVAHLAEFPTDPTFVMDDDTQGSGQCLLWEECHSSVAMPEAVPSVFFQGLSLQFQWDFHVRLHVEWLPEPEEKVFEPVSGATFGLRTAWGDYDNDGWDDFVTTGPVLYRNQGDGTFAVTTSSAGITAMNVVGSGVWGDYDNDGCVDMFLTSADLQRPNSLLHNECNGTFTNVAAVAGVTGLLPVSPCAEPVNLYPASEANAWVDLDGDGLLDIYVATYNCAADLSDYVDMVYRNQGDGTFAEWTGTRGFLPTGTASRGADPIDYDGDGDQDVFVNNYVLEANLFFRNDGAGQFSEIGKQNGTAGVPRAEFPNTYYGHTIGSAWGDLDGDLDFDLVSANLAHPRFFDFSNKTQILLQDGPIFTDAAGTWAEPSSPSGIRYQETHTMPALADFDQDGALDLVISARYDGRPHDFYWGNGDGTFELDVLRAGIDTPNGWGLAAADFDHDGDVDLATFDDLYRNVLGDRPTLGSRPKGSWVQVRAVGDGTSNRAAIGATIRVTAGGRTFVRHVQGGTGQGCQDSLAVHFGLGDATAIDEIVVVFPAGATRTWTGPIQTGQRLWALESGGLVPGWSPP